MLNTAPHLDIEQIASACGLRKSRAIAGGVYLCNDEALRAFAAAVASQSQLYRSEQRLDALEALPSSERETAEA